MHFALAAFAPKQRALGHHRAVVRIGVVKPQTKETREVVHVHGVVREVARAPHLPWTQQRNANFGGLQLAPQEVIEPAHLNVKARTCV